MNWSKKNIQDISKFVNQHFERVIRDSCVIQSFKSDISFHNQCRLETIPKGKNTYCGRMKCGITSLVLGKQLKKCMDIQMFKYQFGYGKYIEDHVFLKSGELIIDPTYRQFFTDNRNGLSVSERKNSGLSEYNNFLYTLPPFFVGTRGDLVDLYHQLKKMNYIEFGYSTISNDLLENWREDYCITKQLK